jgi:hypothetical protein
MLQGLLNMISAPQSMALYGQEVIESRTNESIVLDSLRQDSSPKTKTKEKKTATPKISNQLESLGLW